MIFPIEGPYIEKEEQKYEELQEYLEKNGESLPEAMDKRRTMRFLCANHFNLKKTWKNIQQHLEWRETIRPIILTEDMRALLDAGYMYIHGRDRNFRPLCFSNTKVLTEIE